MKRIISIVLLICIVFTILPTNAMAAVYDLKTSTEGFEIPPTPKQINPFADISESDWFYDDVLYVLDNGIFNGSGENTFSPYDTMTRAMYVTVIGRIAGVNPDDYSGNGNFADVEENAYYAPYVAWAVEKGITNGVGNGQFDPDATISREQMAALTVRFFDAHGIDYGVDSEDSSGPEDLSNVSAWAQDSVLKLWRAGLFQGDSNGRFNPRSSATRAQAAALCTRTNQTVSTTPSPPSSGSGGEGVNYTYYTVSYNSNGGANVDPIRVRSGRTISRLPIPNKKNAIFLGWYEDEGLYDNEFKKDTAVTSNITLYAKYLEIVEEIAEEELDDSFVLIDQGSDLSISLESSDLSMTADDVLTRITLEDNIDSDSLGLIITGSNGIFTLKETEGFVEGASYKLILDDERLTFTGQEDHVRRCSFTINKEEVYNIEFNSDIVYIV